MLSRRALVASGTALVAAVAGCTGLTGSDNGDEGSESASPNNDSENASGDTTDSGGSDDSDAAAGSGGGGPRDDIDDSGESNNTDSGGGSDDTVDVESAATDWIAEEALDGMPVRVQRPASLAAVDGFDYSNTFAGDLPVLTTEEVGLQITGRNGPVVLLGTFDANDVVHGFEESAMEALQSNDSYRGYDLYSEVPFTSGTVVLGVDDGAAVVATERARLETTIDASRGDATRLVDANSEFEQLQSEFEDAQFYQTVRPETESDLLFGLSVAVDPGETQVTVVTDHGGPGDAESFAEVAPDLIADAGLTDPSVDIDGETVRATGTISTGELSGLGEVADTLFGSMGEYFGLTGEEEPDSPQVSFDYNYDETSETLAIAVVAGDTFTAGQVIAEGSGFDAAGASWAEFAGEEVSPETTVTAGDQVVLEGVAPNATVELTWVNPDGGDSVVVGVFTGPDA